MNIFLTEDNQIILPHLNHVLKSYYHTTNYSVYAYNHQGNLIDKVTKDNFCEITKIMNTIAKTSVKDFSENSLFSARDSFLYEVYENIFTIIAPVIKDKQLIMFLITEPFFVETLNINEKKDLYRRTSHNTNSFLTYSTYSSLEKINSNRLNYLGQLFYHLMSNSIYIGQQHFQSKLSMGDTLWGKSLPLDSLKYTDGFVNLPVVKQICDHLAIKDIQGALKTYQLIQTFQKLPFNDKCPLKMLKYRLIAMITLIHYHLSQHFRGLNIELHQTANMCILQMNCSYNYSSLSQFGETVIRKFYQVIEGQYQLQLSANILQALEYIHSNYMNKIRLTDIARSIPMNETYLSTQFKQEYKMPLNQYLSQYRIKQAIILIKNSSYKLTEIALMVGFESSNYFSTVFKKYTGMTPSQYSKI